MSYQKKESGVTSVPNSIRFYYKQDSIFSRVAYETAMRAKSIKDQSGEAQLDDFALTEDERNLFKIFFDRALLDVLKVFLKHTKGIPKADVIDENGMESTTPSTTSDDYGEFEIRDNDAYKSSTLEWIDRQVKEMLTLHVKSSWYESVGLEELSKLSMDKYLVAKRDLVNRGLHDLLKTNIT